MKWLFNDEITWDIICNQNHRFSGFRQMRHQWTIRPTDRRTDKPSYRDARTHLKIQRKEHKLGQCYNVFLIIIGKIENSVSVSDQRKKILFSSWNSLVLKEKKRKGDVNQHKKRHLFCQARNQKLIYIYIRSLVDVLIISAHNSPGSNCGSIKNHC